MLLFYVVWIVLGLTLGAYCFDYALWAVFGQNISWVGDAIVGMLCSGFIVGTAIVLKILDWFGLNYPLVG
jgi:hypothetical protein